MFDTLPNNFYLFFYDTLKCLPLDYQEFNERIYSSVFYWNVSWLTIIFYILEKQWYSNFFSFSKGIKISF